MYGNSESQKTISVAKIYWYSLAGSAILLSILAILSSRALDFGETPNERIVNYQSFFDKLFYTNYISFLILLVLAIYQHYKHNKPIYYLPMLCLFVLFAMVSLGVLSEKFFHFKQEYELDGGSFSLSYFFALAIAIAGALVVLCTFAGVKLARRKKLI